MSKPRILVAEDERNLRQVLVLTLQNAGYEVIEAEDGVEGATAIRANPTASLANCDVNIDRKSVV